MAEGARAAWLALAAIAAASLAACARTEPPAPVTSGSGPPPRPAAAALAAGTVTVQPGDSLHAIARREKVPLRALIDANRLQAPYTLRPGQTLVVPAARVHVVQAGESVGTVARRYGVDSAALARANGLQPPFALRAGQTLTIPGAGSTAPATAVAAAPPPAVSATPGAAASPAPAAGEPPAGQAGPGSPPVAGGTPAAGASQGPAAAPPPGAPAAPPAGSAPPPAADTAARGDETLPPARGARAFVWPVRGNVISTFGQKPGGLQNDGINIAAPLGAPVRAADSGVVVYAGNELKGFGNLLLLRHADGWMTAYAHLESIAVERGQSVQRGQVVAKVGQSGGVAGPQLHFEVRRGTRPVDPRDHLQPLVAAALR